MIRKMKIRNTEGPLIPSQIMFLSLVFLIGCALGTAVTAYAPSVSACITEAEEYICGDNLMLIFRKHLLPDALMLLLLLISSLVAASAVVSAICMAAKGFSASAVCTAYLVHYGAEGYLSLFSLYFLPMLITASCLFIMSLQSLYMSEPVAAKRRGLDTGSFVASAAVCLLLSAGSVLFTVYIGPYLRSMFALINF